MTTTVKNSFDFSEFYNFPPFFTLQPVRETREKQLNIWKNLLLNWHKDRHESILIPKECKLFSNDSIGRSLNDESRRVILQHLIESGHAEWEDETRARCRIMWRAPVDIAASIYAYAQEHGMLSNVYTVYEIHSGEETQSSDFYGLEPWLVLKALRILEKEGKIQIFQGDTSEEDGVKFLETN